MGKNHIVVHVCIQCPYSKFFPWTEFNACSINNFSTGHMATAMSAIVAEFFPPTEFFSFAPVDQCMGRAWRQGHVCYTCTGMPKVIHACTM